jgi:hypothetical protein
MTKAQFSKNKQPDIEAGLPGRQQQRSDQEQFNPELSNRPNQRIPKDNSTVTFDNNDQNSNNNNFSDINIRHGKK